MFCKKCGTEIPNGSNRCENCGFELIHATQTLPVEQDNEKSTVIMGNEEQNHSVTENKGTESSTNAKKLSVWNWLSIASLLCGLFTFYKGIDRMVNYDNGEYYPYELVNAYVGGDAYNYIINGTHATAFFVLTAMFVLASIGLLIVHYVAKNKREA